MAIENPIIVSFFKLDSGREPVRDWLKLLPPESRKIIGKDIKTVQFFWPIGYPTVTKMNADLWEIRSTIPNGIARIFFTLYKKRLFYCMALLKKYKKLQARNSLWLIVAFLN